MFKFKKIFFSFILIVSFLNFSNLKVFADSNSYYSNQIYVANTETFYADDTQWRQINGNWMCGTDEQPYHNAWICTDGKWYYINTSCYLVENCWINDYYVGSDGAWISNANKNDTSLSLYH